MRVLVTGASSGLGNSLVLKLAGSGHDVIALDRDNEGLEKVAGPAIQSICCDLSDINELERRMDELAELGPFHHVMLNAGISATGNSRKSRRRFIKTSWRLIRWPR